MNRLPDPPDLAELVDRWEADPDTNVAGIIRELRSTVLPASEDEIRLAAGRAVAVHVSDIDAVRAVRVELGRWRCSIVAARDAVRVARLGAAGMKVRRV